MISIAGIDHIVLRTDRINEMLAFYGEVLGCTLERDASEEFGLWQLRAGSALIDLVSVAGKLGRQGGEAPGTLGNNMDHFCLQIEPLPEPELREHLRRHGVEMGDFAPRYGAQGFGNSLYIKDPDGNTVELRHRLGSG